MSRPVRDAIIRNLMETQTPIGVVMDGPNHVGTIVTPGIKELILQIVEKCSSCIRKHNCRFVCFEYNVTNIRAAFAYCLSYFAPAIT